MEPEAEAKEKMEDLEFFLLGRKRNSELQVSRDSCERPDIRMNWSTQFKLLLWKNYTMMKWQRFVIITEFIMSFFFAFILLLFRYIISEHTVKAHEYVSLPIKVQPLFLSSNPEDSWQVIYVPSSSSAVKTIIEDFQQSLGSNVQVFGFPSENVFEDYVKYHSNSSNVLTGIIFDHNFQDGKDSLPLQVSYLLRFNYIPKNLFFSWKSSMILDTIEDWNTDLLFPLFPEKKPRNPNYNDGGTPGYFAEGFLFIQHALDKAIMRYHAGNIATHLFNSTSVYVKRFPFPDSSIDDFYFIFKFFLPLAIIFAFSLLILAIIHTLVWEKEKKFKEYLHIMGISNLLLWSSYFLTYFIFFFITIILLIIIFFSKIVALPIIRYSEGSLVFFFMFCFAVVSILFSFMVSTLFSNANVAVSLGSFLYFITYVPYPFIHSYYNVMSLKGKLLSCLLSNVALLLGIRLLFASEIKGTGIHWTELLQPVTIDDELAFGHICGMLIFDCFFYALVTWYIEAVFPGIYGIPLPWNFFLMSSYWFGTSTNNGVSNTELRKSFIKSYVEADPVDLKTGIEIHNLSKEFIINNNKNQVVSDLTLNLYEGQITVLLGHNGAGKTTVLSMLTGIYPPTSGEAYISGYDISSAMVQIRKILGFCPQHDILFDYMTLADHLYFYGQLKGLTLKECHKTINQTLNLFNLEGKRNAFSSSLTRGMKQMLCISIALLGDSKVIILDEPTSGMDPISRRITWDLLQQYKCGRTILLTTQLMDEADLLGDRIAIMAQGKLQCCGSSLFLKQKYGTGYHMTIVKDLHCDIKEICQIVCEYVPNSTLESNFGTELYFILPKESIRSFKALLTELENRQKDLGIASYGISVTTMEEVFLRVSKLVDSKMDLHTIQLSSLNQQDEIAKSSSDNRKDHRRRKKMSDIFTDINTQHLCPVIFNTGSQLYHQQFYAMFVKKAIYCWRNWKMMTAHMLMLLALSSLMISSFTSSVIHTNSLKKMDLKQYGKTIVPYSVSGNTTVTDKFSKYLNMMLKSKGQELKLVEGNLDDFLMKSKNCIYHCIVAISLQVIDDKLIATALFNNQAYHSPATAIAVLDNILFMVLSGPEASIMIANKPQPLSFVFGVNEDFFQVTSGQEISFSLSFGMSTLVSSFSIPTVSERVMKVKHMQFLSGACILTFWLSALIWDLFNFFIPCLFLLVIFKACGVYAFYEHFVDVLLIFIFYGWSIIPLVYLMSFFFSQSAAAYIKLVILNFFLGWSSFIFIFLVDYKVLNLGNYTVIMNNLFMMIPNYNLEMAVCRFYENFKALKICNLISSTNCYGSALEDFYTMSDEGIKKYMISMAVSGFGFLFLLFLIELFGWRIKNYIKKFLFNTYQKCNWNLDLEADPSKIPEDEDVVNERNKILEYPQDMITSLNSPLVIRKLLKIYYTKAPIVAVNKLSLTVQKGECFGLLGPSGSGKTSTFQMLTGDESITSGDAFFEDYSICKDIIKVREKISYCPQCDTLLDHMTGREMLIMHARLWGIPEHYIQEYVEDILKVLLMEVCSDKLTETYSGGTKRKLNTAIALIGNPSVIFLDEPSTGMDPVARRLLWDLVARSREAGKAIFLSSQSLEEYEVLCTRLAIMTNGKLRCLGSPQDLKNKFGRGYTLVAKTKNEIELEYFKEYIMMTFPDSTKIQEHQGMVTYCIPSENLRWSTVFDILENVKDIYDLEDYFISQTTLEEVFMHFAKAGSGIKIE